MKRLFKLIAWMLLLLMSFLPAHGFAALEAADLSLLNAEDSFVFQGACCCHSPGQDGYSVQQGIATDGTYAYLIQTNPTIHRASIRKYRLEDWSYVDCKYNLPLDHGNDLTYNANTNMLVVCNGEGNDQYVTFVDPDTLEIVGSHKLNFQFHSVAYDPERDQYAFGAFDWLIITDGNFKTVSYTEKKYTGLVVQGMDCDSQWIYFPENSRDLSAVRVFVYDWDGRFVAEIPVLEKREIESMFHIGDDFYIAFNSYASSYVYQMKLYRRTQN